MTPRPTHTRRQRRGNNAMEFALTLPIFLVITFGMIEFGWFFSRIALVNSAALDGCRLGALIDPLNPNPTSSPPSGSPAQVASARMASILASGGITCTNCSAVVTGSVPFRTLECTTVIQYPHLTGLLPLPNTVSSYSQVRMEWQRN